MAILRYPVLCYGIKCQQPAVYKVSARWSDGITDELKTYSLACTDCLSKLFAQAVMKQATCRLAPGEVLELPGIYELNRGERDKTLKRRRDLEEAVTATGGR